MTRAFVRERFATADLPALILTLGNIIPMAVSLAVSLGASTLLVLLELGPSS